MNTIIYFFLPPIIIAILFSYPLLINFASTDKNFNSFILGTIFYILIHLFFGNTKLLNKLYIISHELSHSIAGLIRGNKIKKIKIHQNKGYVSFKKKPDKFTVIFPYIFPFYNIILSIISIVYYYLFRKFSFSFFLFSQGFTITFHIINTLQLLATSQNDFKKFGGKLKSIIIILVTNLIFLSFLFIILFPSQKILYSFTNKVINNYINILKLIINFLLNLFKYAHKFF